MIFSALVPGDFGHIFIQGMPIKAMICTNYATLTCLSQPNME